MSAMSTELHDYLVSWMSKESSITFGNWIKILKESIAFRLSKLNIGCHPHFYSEDWQIRVTSEVLCILCNGMYYIRFR